LPVSLRKFQSQKRRRNNKLDRIAPPTGRGSLLKKKAVQIRGRLHHNSGLCGICTAEKKIDIAAGLWYLAAGENLVSRNDIFKKGC
jgi:hypothetical protein